MLLHACHRLDIETHVLDPDPQAPAAPLASSFVQGSFQDAETVYRFGRGLDVLTIEIEHVAVEALRHLQKEGVAVYPDPDLLATVQDKGLQKQAYAAHGLPTAPFRLVEDPTTLGADELITPKALKLRTGGYDGKGVQMLRSPEDLAQVFRAPCVLEEAVAVDKEVAVLVARSTLGEVAVFPAVEMVFHPRANLVELLFSPAHLSDELAQRCQSLALAVADKLGVVGLLAVELFVTATCEVLINEIAPRPHNSGHHTQEANLTSQFEQHLRAILGLPLGATDLKTPAAMVNLLGAAGAAGFPVYTGLEKALAVPGVTAHLYGKQEVRPFRKMGHLTICNPYLELAIARAREVQQYVTVNGDQP